VYIAVAKLSEIDYIISDFCASAVFETRLCFYTSYSMASHNANLDKYFPQEVSSFRVFVLSLFHRLLLTEFDLFSV
jgi:hypothetical protein